MLFSELSKDLGGVGFEKKKRKQLNSFGNNRKNLQIEFPN